MKDQDSRALLQEIGLPDDYEDRLVKDCYTLKCLLAGVIAVDLDDLKNDYLKKSFVSAVKLIVDNPEITLDELPWNWMSLTSNNSSDENVAEEKAKRSQRETILNEIKDALTPCVIEIKKGDL